MDPLGRANFGDLNDETVAEVWFSEGRQHYVELHEAGRGTECDVCCNCNIFSV
jgi:hypothetical protein